MRTTDEIHAAIANLKWQTNHPVVSEGHRLYADGALAALEWLLSEKRGSAALRNKKDIVAFLKGLGVRHCRRCGCTEDYACAAGCSWAKPDICSRCV